MNNQLFRDIREQLALFTVVAVIIVLLLLTLHTQQTMLSNQRAIRDAEYGLIQNQRAMLRNEQLILHPTHHRAHHVARHRKHR